MVHRILIAAMFSVLTLNTDALAQSPRSVAISTVSVPQPLFDFDESQIKFSLRGLMNTLRDKQHEGWVLAAYPDPKTKRPLIGAGFSLDVEAVEHPQLDPLNPRQFVEPSSAQLWEAAGLPSAKLERILDKFERDSQAWSGSKRRRKLRIKSLPAQVTEQEATKLLRISAIQAVVNARAYCRGFDDLTASQQMGLSQLVFQMGVNLQGFVQFLAALNGDPPPPVADDPTVVPTATPRFVPAVGVSGDDRWRAVQGTLIDSQWARLYSGRAATVIAMFDPQYADQPSEAQRQVEATLMPAAVHRTRGRTTGALKNASLTHKASQKSNAKVRRRRS